MAVTGRCLRRFGPTKLLAASDRNELAAVLRVPSGGIVEHFALTGDWRALRIDVTGKLDAKTVNWQKGGINAKLRSGVNLVIVVIDSGGGSPVESARLAS